MKRKAVSSIISALLMICIVVIGATVTYAYVSGMIGQLTNFQSTWTTQRLIPAAYNWEDPTLLIFTVENIGSPSIQLDDIFVNGVIAAVQSSSCALQLQPNQSCTISIGINFNAIPQQSYTIQFVTSLGATFIFSATCKTVG